MFGKFSKFIAALLYVYFLCSCASFPMSGTVSYTLVSDQADKINRHYTSMGASVEGKDCYMTVLFYTIWFGTPLVEETLLSRVLEENNADALMDAEFKSSFVFFPLIFSRSCLTVSGTPVKVRKGT
jgi:hypothetical protein